MCSPSIQKLKLLTINDIVDKLLRCLLSVFQYLFYYWQLILQYSILLIDRFLPLPDLSTTPLPSNKNDDLQKQKEQTEQEKKVEETEPKKAISLDEVRSRFMEHLYEFTYQQHIQIQQKVDLLFTRLSNQLHSWSSTLEPIIGFNIINVFLNFITKLISAVSFSISWIRKTLTSIYVYIEYIYQTVYDFITKVFTFLGLKNIYSKVVDIITKFCLQVSNRWGSLVFEMKSLYSTVFQILMQMGTYIWSQIVNRSMKDLPYDLINFIRNIPSLFHSQIIKNDIFLLKCSIADTLLALKDFLFWNPLIIFRTSKPNQQKHNSNDNSTNNSSSNNTRTNFNTTSTDTSPNSSNTASPSTRTHT